MYAWNVPAELRKSIVLGFRGNVSAYIHAVKIVVSVTLTRAERVRRKECSDRSVVSGAAGLSDNLNDAAVPLAILRLEGPGLHLNFFDEGQIDACSQRSVDRAHDTQSAVAAIGDI